MEEGSIANPKCLKIDIEKWGFKK